VRVLTQHAVSEERKFVPVFVYSKEQRAELARLRREERAKRREAIKKARIRDRVWIPIKEAGE
jgi:hypothetical protein